MSDNFFDAVDEAAQASQAPADPVEPAGNFFDAVDEEEESENKFLGLMFEESLRSTPDRKAGILKLARQTGLNPGLVESNFDEFARTARALNFDPKAFREKSPLLAAFMANRPHLAPLAFDPALDQLQADLQPGAVAERDEEKSFLSRGLGAVARAVQFAMSNDAGGGTPDEMRELAAARSEQFGQADKLGPSAALEVKEGLGVAELRPAPPDLVPPLKRQLMQTDPAAGATGLARLGMYPSKFAQTRKGLEQSRIGTKLMFADARGQEDTFELEKQLIASEQDSGLPRFYDAGPVEAVGLDVAEAAASQVDSFLGQGIGAGIGAAVGAGLGHVAGAVLKVPGMAKQGAKAGARIGGKLAGTAVSFDLEAGGAYLEYRQMKTDDGQTLDKHTAIGMAAFYGLLAAMIETGANTKHMEGLGAIGQLVANGERKAVAKAILANTTLTKRMKELAKTVIGSARTEGGEEFSQEALQMVVGWMGRSGYAGGIQDADIPGGIEQALEAGRKGAVGGGALGGAQIVVQSTEQALTARRAETAAKQAAAILAAAKTSRLAAADPQAFGELVAVHTAESGQPATHVYVDPAAVTRLFQGQADPEAALRDLLGEDGAQRLEEAMATGGKLAVPVAEFAERWAPHPVASTLQPGDITTRQSLPTTAEQEAQDQQLHEDAKALADQYLAENTPVESDAEQRLVDAVQKQLAATGTYSKADARTAVALNRAILRTMAQRFGMPADALFDHYVQTVERSDQPQKQQDLTPAAAPSSAAVFRAMQPVASLHLGNRVAQLQPADRATEVLIDPVSGLRNRRAWNATPRTPGKMVAIITTPDAKPINDHIDAGHEFANELLRTIGAELFKFDPGAARGGTNFLLEVTDQKELDTVLAQVKRALPNQLLAIEGALAPDVDAAFAALDAGVDAKRDSGELPARGLAHPDLDIPGLRFQRGRAAAAVPQSMIDQVGKMTDDQFFADAYMDPVMRGVLNGIGWARIPRRPWVASIDMRGLKAINTSLGQAAGDEALKVFAAIIVSQGGAAHDFAHLSGDEFAMQAETQEELEEFLRRVHVELARAGVELTVDGEALEVVLGFRHGTGAKTYAAADRDLNVRKQAEQRAEQQRADAEAPAAGVPARVQAVADGGGEGGGDQGPGQNGLDAGRGADGRGADGAGDRSDGPAAGGITGAPTRVKTPQVPRGEPAHYRVIEVEDLIPSHSPDTFRPRPDYPAGVQERDYHRQKEEQAKVVRGGQELDPDFVLASTPSPLDGPPLVTSGDRALVLGGNGRSMMLQLALRDEATREHYRAELLRMAPLYGLDPAALKGMRAPVLVRSMDAVPHDAPAAELIAGVRRFNEGMTQALSPKARAVADAKSLGGESVQGLGQLLASDSEATLRDVMRDRPSEVIAMLRRDGVITDQNQSALLSGGNLTEEAKDRVEGMFLGRVVGTGDRMTATAPALLAKVERMAAELIRVQGSNPDFDMIPAVQAALDLLNDARRRGLKLDELVNQGALFAESAADPSAAALAHLLQEETPRALQARFRRWASRASFDPRQATMFEKAPTKEGLDQLLLGETQQRLAQSAAESLPVLDSERERYAHSPAEGAERGFVEFARAGLKRIFRVVLNPTADLSTFLHESGHVFLEMTADLAERPDAPEQLRADWQATLKWLGVGDRASIKTQQHEQWARGFEAYLLEGNAPSTQLGRAFARMKLWLKKLYRDVAALDVTLSDDIRGVFDRLLATDAEIERAKNRQALQPMFRSPEDAGMNPAQWQAYLEAQEKATSRASLAAEHRVLKDRLREAEAWWKDEEGRLREEAAEEYQRRADVRVWRFITGRLVQGVETEPVRLNRGEVEAAIGAHRAKELFTGRMKRGGAGIDDVASMFGFGSGREMLDALVAMPKQAEWVRTTARERMLERHPDVLTERAELRALVEKGLHGDATADWLLQEWAALRSRAGSKGAPPVAAIRRAAEMIVERQTIGQLRPDRALQAERSAGEKAMSAAARGDYAQAYVFKQQQLLNHHIYRATRQALETAESAERYLAKRTADSYRAGLGKAAPEYLAVHDAILGALGFAEQRAERGEQLAALRQAVERAAADAADLEFDVDHIRALIAGPVPWAELKLAEAENVRAAVANIRAAANAINEVVLAGEKFAVEELVNKIAAEAEVLPDQGPAAASRAQVTAGKRALLAVQGLDGALLDPETLVGFLGPTAHRALFGAYIAARNYKDQLAREILQVIAEQWEKLPAEMRARRWDVVPGLDARLPIPDGVNLGGPRDRSWLWMVGLNMGNASNRDRLLGGFKWSEQQVLDVLTDPAIGLSKQEWDFLQAVWDLNDQKLWPLISAKEQRKTGLPSAKIEATPISTPHGEFAGGYFPAKYDKNAAAGDIGERQAEAGIASLYGPSYVRASTLKSHTKKRAASYENVLDLNWAVVPSHMAQVIHDVAFDEYVRGAGRVVFHPTMQKTLFRRLGERRSAQVREWLKVVANEQADAVPGAIADIMGLLGEARGRLVIGAIGHSLTVALGDLSNPFVAMAQGKEAGGISARNGIPALVNVLRPERMRAALERSAELRHRRAAGAVKLKEHLREIGAGRRGPVSSALEMVRATSWFFMEQTDKMAAAHAWIAAHADALQEGQSEADAVRHADARVRATLPTQDLAEQPAVLRDRRGLGSLLVFYGYFNKLLNMSRRQAHGPFLQLAQAESRADFGKAGLATAEAAGRFLAVLFFANVAAELLSGRGPEEDEDWGQWMARKMLAAPFGLLPFAAPFAEAAADVAVTGKGKKLSVRAAPALSIGQSLYEGLGKLASDERADSQKVWDAVEVLLIGLKLPARQVRKSGEYLGDVFAGDENPESPADFISGAVYGKRKKQPANPASVVNDATR